MRTVGLKMQNRCPADSSSILWAALELPPCSGAKDGAAVAEVWVRTVWLKTRMRPQPRAVALKTYQRCPGEFQGAGCGQCGLRRLHLDLNGPIWADLDLMSLFGPVWAYLGVSGPIWAEMSLFGHIWAPNVNANCTDFIRNNPSEESSNRNSHPLGIASE